MGTNVKMDQWKNESILVKSGKETAPSSPELCTIWVVDDDEAMRSLLAEALQERGCAVTQLGNGHEVLDLLKAKTPSLIVTDLRMPGGGFSYVEDLRKAVPDCPIVLMTAYGDAHSKAKALSYGLKGYFEKPVRIQDLKSWICQLCLANPCGNVPLI
ncbi:MAG: response regulator [Nitrospirales bacterium]